MSCIPHRLGNKSKRAVCGFWGCEQLCAHALMLGTPARRLKSCRVHKKVYGGFEVENEGR